ncbi:MAG: acetyl-CoA decarbonylase/synthase complex subunit gamma [Methanoregula sp.]|nr:acetyl-CoA decarbonylase/synthase complex subunit gamma [Methanoregula sp.]
MSSTASLERKQKKSIREISPIDVYKFLPKTNCRECGESNCMAFATRVVNGERVLTDCPPLYTDQYQDALLHLTELLSPPVRTVVFGAGTTGITIGGKYVLQRHEFTYQNPTPIAIDVHDLLPDEELKVRVRQIEQFSYPYIGRKLSLDAIAIRSVSGDRETFRTTVKKTVDSTSLPVILVSLDPAVIEAGLTVAGDRKPLLYAATKDNWNQMAELALTYQCPLVVFAPQNLPLLRSLVRTLLEYGVVDLVLDPGTAADNGLSETIHNFTAIRTAACRYNDDLFGFPLMGVPMTVWNGEEISEDILKWREAVTASMLLTRYADVLIMHSLDGWVLLPQLIWRFNIYTDPRKPISVEAGIREYGKPDRDSPVLVTSNYALTYFTVESDIKAANLDCYLVVIDTGGLSVESAIAGRNLTPDSIVAALKDHNVGSLVNHTTLIIPGLAARISGDTEEASGWSVLVGPKDSSGIPNYLKDRWPVRS